MLITMRASHPSQGFTLIELSIVLVIIGLIVGGILVGQDLVKAAQLRSVMTDVERFRTAVNTFSLKYNCLPGDCDHATIYWGRADGGADASQNCASPETDISAANPTATCNGDGNGTITGGTVQQSNLEAYRFWQHLSNAELVPGHYSGIGGAIDPLSNWRAAKLGVNAPMMRFGVANGYLPVYGSATNMTMWTGSHITEPSNRMWAGSQTATNPPWDPNAFTPADAYSIDIKEDDGLPGLGTVIAYGVTSHPQPCATTDVTDTGVYSLTNKNYICGLIFTLNR